MIWECDSKLYDRGHEWFRKNKPEDFLTNATKTKLSVSVKSGNSQFMRCTLAVAKEIKQKISCENLARIKLQVKTMETEKD